MEVLPELAPVVAKHRRGQIEILVDILTLASPFSCASSNEGVTKTHLAASSGLNFRRLEKYLELLVQRKLIEVIDCRKNVVAARIYRTTASGERMRSILLEAEELILGTDDLDNYTIKASASGDRW
jgi:predicted transcriptional regulator